MATSKPVTEFSIFNWRNIAFGFILVGLIITFLTNLTTIGLGLLGVGIIFLAVLYLHGRTARRH